MADSNQPSDDFFNEFLDDYFAECEEHLTVVRRCLLDIEQFIDERVNDQSKLDEMFRAFHTIKGISGMVGLAQAEQLSHEMEGYLRLLRQNEVWLTQVGFDSLLEGTRVLEEVIQAHKDHNPIPEIAPAVASISKAAANDTQVTSPTASPSSRTNGGNWRFLFTPSKEHAASGINVNLVRERLQEIGQITRTTPLIEAGDVLFEFIVDTNRSLEELQPLSEIGLTFSELQAQEDLTGPVATSATSSSAATSVRVELVRLDQLMLQVGELVVTRARLEQNLNSIRSLLPAATWRQLQEVKVALGKQLRDLRNDVMRVRMVPIAEVFDRMRFVMRDIARETRKRVTIDLSGKETEIDKYLVERLMDPLLHLVRNSISHGIESEQERIAAGKPAEGRVFLRAQTSGELVIIEIGDDGRGIDIKKIEEKSPGEELINAHGEIDTTRLLEIISAPGFSTRKSADMASGRGVGMDVVAKSIHDLDGQLSLKTEEGVGTTFRIQLPLTLAITDALIASADGQTFAIHRSSVEEVIELESQDINVLENNEVILHRDEVLPLVRLSRIFNLNDKREGRLQAFVVGTGNHRTGLVVDKVVGLREVVVRSLNDPLVDVPGIAGATELGDGRPVLILDVMEILRVAQNPIQQFNH